MYNPARLLRRDRIDAYTAGIGAKELAAAVDELRAGIDLSNVESADLPSFDTALAFDLYRQLFQPAEPLLAGARHVFVVPDGALTGLPLGVLVTEAPAAGPGNVGPYREVPWLARRYAMAVLPSVSSLRALRLFARRARADKPFIGFGDPLLDDRPGGGRGIRFAALYRGAVANVAELRRLPRLPETADELRRIAAVLGASQENLYLGKFATETTVKSVDLSGFQVVSFATHGLLAGELSGLVEPALVLTPPDQGTAADDGLLTASEIAELKLDADWVILSACNTAAAGEPDGEGLSGLAKAFFYAGSRALLVSHWPVSSDATVALMTALFAEAAADPTIGRSEAHRRAMLSLMNDTTNTHYAHPAFWAPFVVVGEGRGGARAASP